MDGEGSTFIEEVVVNEASQASNQVTVLKWKDAIRQIIASAIVLSISIPAGINMSFSAILLPQLYNDDDIYVTKAEASWIASLVTISLPIGTVLTGVLMDRFGRKRASMFATIPFTVVWVVTATAKDVETLYFARLLAGVASGLTTTSIIYTSEVTHPNFRPMLLSLTSIYVSLGILLTCLLGNWCHWRTMCYVFFFLEVVIFALLFVIPESPYWLVVFKNDSPGASRSLRWIYRNSNVFYNEMQRFFAEEVKKPGKSTQQQFHFFRFGSYRSPHVYKPLVILAVLFIIQQLSGAYVIIFYAVDVFVRVSHVSKSTVNEDIALILLGVIRFLASVATGLISKRVGRKRLLLVSGVGMCLFSFISGLYMKLLEDSMEYDRNVPLFCILGYVCFGSIGYLLIPWTLIGELLPVDARGKLGSFLIGLAYVFMFGVVKAFPYLVDMVTLSTIFCALSVINIVGIYFVQRFLPETLGKRFSEIEKHFNGQQSSIL